MHVARSMSCAFALACLPVIGCPGPPKSPTTAADAATPTPTSTPTSTPGADAEAETEIDLGADADAEVEAATPAIYGEDYADPRTCTDDYPKGTPSSWKSCPYPGSCTLLGRGCCSPCGMPQRCDVYAVSTMYATPFGAKICPAPTPCPACAGAANPWLQAFCLSGACTVVDVRTDAISACASDDDCVARTSLCCDDCTGGDFAVALRKDQVNAYKQQVCGKTKCMQCKAPPPQTHKAICHPVRKHCVIAS